MMKPWLRKLAHFWLQKVNPQIATLIATIGTVGLILCLAIIYLVAQLSEEVLEREAFGFDKTILLWIHSFANPAIDTIMLNVTRLGNPTIVVLVTLVTLAILWWRRYRQEAKIFLLNCLGGAILTYGLKLAFSKSRPQLWKSLISETSYSYQARSCFWFDGAIWVFSLFTSNSLSKICQSLLLFSCNINSCNWF